MVRLEGSKLFLEYNGTSGAVLTNSYQLGTIFTIKFEASSGHVKTYFNDASIPADDFAANETGCYFKAGCYTQSNVSKGDIATAYGEVVIYDVRVTHQASAGLSEKTLPVPVSHSLSIPNGRSGYTASGRRVPRMSAQYLHALGHILP